MGLIGESQLTSLLNGINSRAPGRSNFTQAVVNELVGWGYNVFVCHPNHRVDGNYTHAHHEIVYPGDFSIGFEVYIMERGNTVYATNYGDGSFENWAFGGTYTRNGKSVTFF